MNADNNWVTTFFKYGKIAALRINCKCNKEITEKTDIGTVGCNIHGDIYGYASCGGNIILYANGIISFEPEQPVPAHTWICGYLIVLLR